MVSNGIHFFPFEIKMCYIFLLIIVPNELEKKSFFCFCEKVDPFFIEKLIFFKTIYLDTQYLNL